MEIAGFILPFARLSMHTSAQWCRGSECQAASSHTVALCAQKSDQGLQAFTIMAYLEERNGLYPDGKKLKNVLCQGDEQSEKKPSAKMVRREKSVLCQDGDRMEKLSLPRWREEWKTSFAKMVRKVKSVLCHVGEESEKLSLPRW